MSKKLKSYRHAGKTLFSPLRFTPILPYSVKEIWQMKKLVSIKSMIQYPDKWESIKACVKVNFICQVGSIAPLFELRTTDGKTIRLQNFRSQYVAFMFVCMTCPPAIKQTHQWNKLRGFYSEEDVALFLIYSRERHPGDPGFKEYCHPKNFQQKCNYAAMHAEMSKLPVAVDTFEQSVLSLYGKIPNQCFVLDREGMIRFKAGWAQMEKVKEVLSILLEEGKL